MLGKFAPPRPVAHTVEVGQHTEGSPRSVRPRNKKPGCEIRAVVFLNKNVGTSSAQLADGHSVANSERPTIGDVSSREPPRGLATIQLRSGSCRTLNQTSKSSDSRSEIALQRSTMYGVGCLCQ